MGHTTAYQKAYSGLPEELAKLHYDLNFDNHCYLRIALDNAVGCRWDMKISRPAYKNCSKKQLDMVLEFLRRYRADRALLLQHNKISLTYRKR